VCFLRVHFFFAYHRVKSKTVTGESTVTRIQGRRKIREEKELKLDETGSVIGWEVFHLLIGVIMHLLGNIRCYR
jgi:hypothetical protein